MQSTPTYNLRVLRQRGFSLIELLVGLFLSLFIVGVALTYFASSSRTFRSHTNESLIQENARFSLELLSKDIRHAGLNPGNRLTQETDVIYTDARCTADEAGLGDGAAGSSACTRDGALGATTNNSDRLAIDYLVDATDSAVNIDSVACNNQTITVNAGEATRFASVYWVADLDGDPGQIRSLYCQPMNLDAETAVGTAAPLIDGVDRMQVQYGVDQNEDGIIERYQSFTNLGAANVDRVRTVRIALLINSGVNLGGQGISEENLTRTYTLLDAAPENFTDSRLRQIYTTTITLPNARPE